VDPGGSGPEETARFSMFALDNVALNSCLKLF